MAFVFSAVAVLAGISDIRLLRGAQRRLLAVPVIAPLVVMGFWLWRTRRDTQL